MSYTVGDYSPPLVIKTISGKGENLISKVSILPVLNMYSYNLKITKYAHKIGKYEHLEEQTENIPEEALH